MSWDEELNVFDDLINVYQKQQKDVQPVKIRKLEAFTRDRNDFANAYRSPDYQHFMYAYIDGGRRCRRSIFEATEQSRCRGTYAQVFGFIRLSTNFLDAKKLNNYLDNLEKYQTLLRENNKAAKAAEYDEFIKEGRIRQKDLESIEKENNP